MTPEHRTAAAGRPWFARAVDTLTGAGVPSPRVDAELLAVHGAGVPRPVSHQPDPGQTFWGLVERRAAREPLQHLLGRAWFRHLELEVGPGVFLPRPETELVAGAAVVEAQRVQQSGHVPVVVDLGTGSGAIALAVATEVPGSVVHAVEIDPAALAWARRSCAGSGVALHHADLRNALPDLSGAVHIVVSNPPYIPPGCVPVDAEVAEHDPQRALYGSDTDGLGEVRAVVATASRLLVPGGLVVIEHADTQREGVRAAFDDSWTQVAGHRDLTDRPRYVTARRGRG